MGDWKHVAAAFAGRLDDLTDRVRARLRGTRARGPVTLVPYLGYGTPQRLFLSGRVLEDEALPAPRATDGAWRNALAFFKRMESDEVPGARVRARFAGLEQEAVADAEGYFHVEIAPPAPIARAGWHEIDLDLAGSLRGEAVRAEVLVPPATARFAVVSDIDDTVVQTNVADKLKMLLALARGNAHTRKPFKGVAAFYQALQEGAGRDGNPIFYVSSSPWNLYTPLLDFMSLQRIPRGPLLLRDFGQHTLFGSEHGMHKLGAIETLLEVYPQLPFILIGDSGEEDPEIYSEVVRRHPGRVRAIYIRSVNPDAARLEAIDRLVAQVRESSAQLVLAPDSEFAAVHAAGEGFISPAALAHVRADRREDERAEDTQDAGHDVG